MIVDVQTFSVATPIVNLKVRRVEIASDDAAIITNPEPWVMGAYVKETAKIINPVPQDSEYRYILESAVITSETYEYFVVQHQDVTDTAVIVSAVDSLSSYDENALDTAVITSTIDGYSFTYEDVLDSAQLESYIDTTAAIDDVVDEPAVITSEASPRTIARVDVVDAFVGTDSAVHPDDFVVIYEAAVIVSEATYIVKVSETVSDSAVITSEAYPREDKGLNIVDTAVIQSLIDSRVKFQETVYERGFLESWISSPGGTDEDSGWGLDDAWTSNVATWAMSRYTDVGINDLGTRFAVSDSGLYERSSDFAAARVETGEVTFGAFVKKRIPNFYVQCNYDGSLTVDVTAEVDGVRATYEYAPKRDTTADSTVVRVDPGKRLHSSYYKFGLNTTGRADLYGCEALVDATQRRI